MTNTKWLRRALLGSVALGVMASGANASELSELKAQLEGLQSRVNELEQRPATPALPEGASFLTLSRGSAEFPNYGTQLGREKHEQAPDRGFTIAVTPTADLPAPVSEVVVYGYVKGDVIYDFDGIDEDTFSVGALFSNDGKEEHWRLHARQTRFGIRSRTDTAIGQIRTQIEGDFFGSSFETTDFRLRHAYGEWDLVPDWTLLIGQTWSTASLHPIGLSVVDFSGYAGPNGFPRKAQVRMTYRSGPISWAVAIERPTIGSDADWPDLASYVQFDAPGGHQFIVTGVITDSSDRGFGTSESDDFGWAVQAGANINLADIATLTVGGLYGRDGAQCSYLAQDRFCSGTGGSLVPHTFVVNPDQTTRQDAFFSGEGWGLLAGLSFGLTDTTTFNVIYGISSYDNDLSGSEIEDITIQTVHANILWRPVRQMQLGWEVMWGQYDIDGANTVAGSDSKDDAMRAQFGAWFFF